MFKTAVIDISQQSNMAKLSHYSMISKCNITVGYITRKRQKKDLTESHIVYHHKTQAGFFLFLPLPP